MGPRFIDNCFVFHVLLAIKMLSCAKERRQERHLSGSYNNERQLLLPRLHQADPILQPPGIVRVLVCVNPKCPKMHLRIERAIGFCPSPLACLALAACGLQLLLAVRLNECQTGATYTRITYHSAAGYRDTGCSAGLLKD